jgi:hypothetical protein
MLSELGFSVYERVFQQLKACKPVKSMQVGQKDINVQRPSDYRTLQESLLRCGTFFHRKCGMNIDPQDTAPLGRSEVPTQSASLHVSLKVRALRRVSCLTETEIRLTEAVFLHSESYFPAH